MNLIEFYNENIVQYFDKYHIPDLNLETSNIVFFLESPHKDEILHKKPLCGQSGINFSKKLFGHSEPFGLWDGTPNYVGIFESSPFPLQKSAYQKFYDYEDFPINSSNSDKIVCFEKFRNIVYQMEFGDKRELINHVCTLPKVILNTKIYQDYCTRVAYVLENSKAETLVLCGLFAQRFFNSYLFQNNINICKLNRYGAKNNTGEITVSGKTYRLIYINHPEEWCKTHTNIDYLKPTIDKLKEIIDFNATQ